MKKIILSIFTLLLLISCKKESVADNFTENKSIVDSLTDSKKASSNHINNQSIEELNKSFTIDCGSGCAMTYNEFTRKKNKNSVEIKYNVTQYINENPQDEYDETYVFEKDSNGFLNSIHLANSSENIITDEDSLLKEYLEKIGYQFYPQKEKTNLNANKENSNQILNSLFKKFEFKYTVTEVETEEDTKYLIKISLRDKETNKIQEIDFTPENLYNKNLNLNTSSHSYFNPKQSLIKASEGIERYRDLIVLDYNFDGREDFAIINYEGSNGGPQYAYYKQKTKGQFELDESFTTEIRFFPIEINNKEKTLEFGHPSGCCQINTFVVKILPNNKWKVTHTKLEDIN